MLCDLSPFYCETGGGIRTYHRARIDWFSRHPEHQYALVCPGRRSRVLRVSSNVRLVEIYGPPATRDRTGYRVLWSYRSVRDVVSALAPDVLETGDPWLSGPFALMMRRGGSFAGLLASFYHSDVITTYVEPWLLKTTGSTWAGRRVASAAAKGMGALQRGFDITMTASEGLGNRLRERGVRNVVTTPLGFDRALLALPRRTNHPGRRLLYAGRLDVDKDIGLLVDLLPGLLARPDVTLTVAGRGKHERWFQSFSHPRFRFEGYIRDPARMRDLLATHDLLLAPGRYETFGLAALEAAAAGLVVVGPDQGGTGDMLRRMNSPLMFAAGDPGAFERCVRLALDSDLAALSRRSREMAATYPSWAEVVARHVALYDSHLEAACPA